VQNRLGSCRASALGDSPQIPADKPKAKFEAWASKVGAPGVKLWPHIKPVTVGGVVVQNVSMHMRTRSRAGCAGGRHGGGCSAPAKSSRN